MAEEQQPQTPATADDQQRPTFRDIYFGEFPKSLNKYRWTPEQIHEALQAKIMQKTKKSTDNFRQAFRLFDATADPETGRIGISKQKLQMQALRKFGLVLDDADLDRLWGRYAQDSEGMISLQDFINNVLPADFPTSHWQRLMCSEHVELSPQEKHDLHRLEELPPSLRNSRWTVRDLEKKIQEKLLQRTSLMGNFNYQSAFRLLEHTPGRGIDRESLEHVLRDRFDIFVGDTEVEALFAKYDPDDTGYIGIQAFIRNVMPRDYTAAQWTETSEEEGERRRQKQQQQWEASRGNFECAETANLTAAQMHAYIKEKISAYAERDDDQWLRAYHKLEAQRGEGITAEGLRRRLKDVYGILLTERQQRDLHAFYNKSGSGVIRLPEFVAVFAQEDSQHRHHLQPRHEKPRTIHDLVRVRRPAEEMALTGTVVRFAPPAPAVREDTPAAPADSDAGTPQPPYWNKPASASASSRASRPSTSSPRARPASKGRKLRESPQPQSQQQPPAGGPDLEELRAANVAMPRPMTSQSVATSRSRASSRGSRSRAVRGAVKRTPDEQAAEYVRRMLKQQGTYRKHVTPKQRRPQGAAYTPRFLFPQA